MALLQAGADNEEPVEFYTDIRTHCFPVAPAYGLCRIAADALVAFRKAEPGRRIFKLGQTGSRYDVIKVTALAALPETSATQAEALY